MNKINKTRLQVNYKLLVDNITAQGISDELFGRGVIDDEELEEITELQMTSKQRVRTLIRILMKKSCPNVLIDFCQVLRDSDLKYEYLAEAIENCDVSSAPDVDEVDSRNTYENKHAELVKTITEQSNMLLECQRKVLELTEENKMLTKRDAQFGVLQSNGFMDKNLLEFADLFFLNKTASFGQNVAGNMPHSGFSSTRMQILNSLSAGTLPPESIIACRLSIDLVHYIVAKKAGLQLHEPFCQAASEMRHRVEEILNHRNLNAMLAMLDIAEVKGFQTFEAVADELFVDGCNWGRVLAWFAFCAHLAMALKCSNEALDLFGMYVWFFLDRIQSNSSMWLSKAGGWGGLLVFLKPQASLINGMVCVMLTGLKNAALSLFQLLYVYYPSQP